MRADIAIAVYRDLPSSILRANSIVRWLQNFGLTAEVLPAPVIGSGHHGKAFLNANYRAAIYLEERRADDAQTNYSEGWNWTTYSPQDIPIAYFGPIPLGQQTRLPADFPIIPFNAADPTTYYQFPHFLGFEPDNPRARQLGTRMRFADSKAAWGRTINYVWNGNGGFTGLFRVYPDRLNADREMLIRPHWKAMGLLPPEPDNVAIGVRYYNRYFLPCLSYAGRGLPRDYAFGAAPGDSYVPGLVLWFLEQADVLPIRKMNVAYDIDHPLPGTVSAEGSRLTLKEIRYVDLMTMRWIREFAREKGFLFQCGILTSGRWRWSDGQHWHYRNQTAEARELDRLLQREHRGVFPCCWHDHSFPIGFVGRYTRHIGGRYGATVNVSGFDLDEYGNQHDPGTGIVNRNFSLRTREAYRLHWEGNLIEMKAMGFPDMWCGENRYLNLAGNEWGNLEFLDFLTEETPVRALRITSTTQMQSGLPNPFAQEDYRLLKYRAIELFETMGLDSGMRGLFNPGSNRTINDADVNQRHNLGVDAGQGDRERQARCRYLALTIDQAIAHYLYVNGVLMNHTDFCHAANPSDPLGDFNATGNWNGMKEVMTGVGEWYDLLRNWLQPGGIRQVVQWRERMRG
jgi:hypothetical protein